MSNKIPLNYKDAGINIDASNMLVNQIKVIAEKTHRQEWIGNFGGFSSLCMIPKKYREPVLVSGIDGVGTKLCLAMNVKRYDKIGIDLVAMCVNDLIVYGAEPLFFFDYYASSKLDIDIAISVINGIADGCLQSGCALVGGETAEMPGIYQNKDFDIIGFCIGIVEKSEIIDNRKVVYDDILIALESSGLHSNGYSLVRKIIDISKCDIESTQLEGKSIADHLLMPTRIYVKNILKLIKHVDVHAIIHLTGGGFLDNIPRVLPDNTQVIIDQSSWQWPEIFNWLQDMGNINQHEMYRIFNCGVGMIIAIPANEVANALRLLKKNDEKAWIIGNINCSNSKQRVIFK